MTDGVSCNFVDTLDAILLYFMVDVMSYVLKPYSVPWQMLLPYIVADIIAILCVIDGITTEADGTTSC